MSNGPLWLLLFAATGCSPDACVSGDDRAIEREVEVLVRESGELASSARRSLAARGFEAIAIVETGLYRANAEGRVRVVKTLIDIAHPEVIPILQHLSQSDPSDQVRSFAAQGVIELSTSENRR